MPDMYFFCTKYVYFSVYLAHDRINADIDTQTINVTISVPDTATINVTLLVLS